MNFNSLRTKITLIFAVTLLFFGTTCFLYIQYDNEHVDAQISTNYEKIATYLMKNRSPLPEVITYIENLNFKLVENPDPILRDGKLFLIKKGIETLYYHDTYYFHFITPFSKALFQDLSHYERNYYGYVFFAFIFMAIIFLYLWLMKSLKPLHELKNNIAKLAKGDFTVECKSDKKDEIAEVANEFNNTAKKIKLLLDSRQLFLRTIMHELKTPIAKGRIVSELINDEKQKNRIVIIFEKLNRIIDDFAKTEQIISNNAKPTMYACRVSDIINRAIDILMLENKECIVLEDISSKKLHVDLELISFALKNLLDNALKYSSDSNVTIKEEPTQLLVISRGAALEKPLEEYYKPFHNDTKEKNHGMGLGLYIVHSIFQMHGMKLEYQHSKNTNIFKLVYPH